MARIVWSSISRDDLKALVSFIKADSPSYAQTFGLHIRQRVEQLHRVPGQMMCYLQVINAELLPLVK